MVKHPTHLGHKRILELYRSGLTQEEVAKIERCHVNTVRRIMQKHNIKVRPHSRIYELDEKFFETINTKKKAYWLGFLLADGTICNRTGYTTPKSLNLSLQWSDHDHVVKFRRAIEYGGSIRHTKYYDKRYSKTRHRADLFISSQKICKDLINLGWIKFKKIGDIQILNDVPNHLQVHLVRGLIDGDGCIIYSEHRNRKDILFHFTDLYCSVVKWMAQWIRTNYGVKEPPIERNGKSRAYALKYHSIPDIQIILSGLYRSDPYLDRKKLISNEVNKIRFKSKVEVGRTLKHAKLITFKCVTDTMGGWCRRIKINRSTFNNRIATGWSIREALFYPKQTNQYG